MDVVAIQQMLYVRATMALESLRTLRDDEEGQGLVEYALILALISVAIAAALTTLKGEIQGVFETIGEKI